MNLKSIYLKLNNLSPRKKKALLILLWIVAPIEMLILTGTIKTIKRFVK